ncbi:MAG TPA: thiolase family protein [Candidatus Krumholzibacteria bacterium]|nr:thiolase family protein [Candidatus Krumholzibacteria bacterium]
MHEVVVTAARRTPIGKFMGSLAEVAATTLGAAAVRAAVADSGLGPDQIDELVFGHARQAGTGPNPARQVVRGAGLPDATPAFTVNKACGSGLKAVLLAAQTIRLGEARVVVAGGMESMSRVPYLLERARGGYRLGHGELVDAMYRDGFTDPLSGLVMGETAEKLARSHEISRREQDEFALESHRRATAAWNAGHFAAEIVAVDADDGRGGVRRFDRDENPREDATLERLARLQPVFAAGGSVTPGNASAITDGAAALVLMDEESARRHGQTILARLVASTQVGVDPSLMGIAPVPALQKLWKRTGLAVDAIDLFELNEAFAAQVLACQREMPLPPARLNVNGGAIALGHPIGSSGARILVTLVHEMRRRQARRGVATLCISGGQGLALLVERAEA